MKYHVSITAIALMAVSFTAIVGYAPCIQAQADIVDSEPLPGRNYPSAPGATKASNSGSANSGNESAQLYFQLQALQQEVLELRGLVEEQAYAMKKLKQQRLDDYMDLDRRLGQLTQSGAASGGSNQNTTANNNSAGVPTSAPTPASVDELKAYRSAINLVIKERNYDKAVTALNQYLVDFPDSGHAPNAKYWLGQIYLQKEDLDQSAAWFKRVVSSHSSHAKAPEAKFKLGKVYYLQGKKADAKALLKEVISSGGAAASLAQAYLTQNF